MKVKKTKYKKDYGIPVVNILPAVVWSIPLGQHISNYAVGGWTLCICIAFVFFYYVMSIKPVIALVPCIASTVMLTGLVWVFADWIVDDVIRVIAKIIILLIVLFIEFGIFSNATVPWLQDKYDF